MNKPENYAFYCNKKNNIPYKYWPVECKLYKDWKRDILRHPEWKDLSDEDYFKAKKESKRQRGLNAVSVMLESNKNMSDEKKKEVNKKKGNGWKNLTPEERNEKSKEMSERSHKFWDGKTSKQRKEFGQYRWNLKTQEEKEIIIKRFNKAGIDRMRNLPKEEIDRQIGEMNKARLKKLEENEEFRLEQIELLRKHNNEYMSNLTREEKVLVLKDNKLNKRFEREFINSVLSTNFYFVKEFQVTIDGNNKFWDYGIYDKTTNELVMVVDLDGSYYHGDSCDYDGLHSREDRDEKRGYFTCNDAKVHIICENKFNEGFDEMIKILMSSYSDYILYLFNQMRSIDFPYPKYSHSELIKSYNQLLRLNDNKYLTLSTRNREGDRLITNFHRSIYHAHKKGKPSPYEAWYNDDLLMKCIENRTIYRSVLDKNKILQGFNISKIAPKVSVFSAGRAKILIYKYLNNYDTIFDPFSGFSGRMLATLSMNKFYIGRDISYIHIKESYQIIDFLIKCKTHFDIIYPDLQIANIVDYSGEYDCLFTCPPYGNKEIWKGGISDTRSCDDWIDICLNNFKCKRYVFVVDDTMKYKEYITDVIINKSHFGKNNEYVVVIDRED